MPPAKPDTASARERVTVLAAEAGIRLNHRAAWVLKIIGKEPGLSNEEIAKRAGGLAKGHASTLLARLKRARLIENTRDHATSPVANAWRLTSKGEELEGAIREGMPRLGERRRGRPRKTKPRRVGPAGAMPLQLDDPDRRRLLDAALQIWGNDVAEHLSAESVAKAARVSADVFDQYFAGVEDCLAAAFEHAATQARLTVSGASVEQDGWLDRTRSGLQALLGFFDKNPSQARVLVVRSADVEGAVARLRAELLAEAAAAIDDEGAPNRGFPPALITEALVAGILGVVQARLGERQAEPLVNLAPPLMSFLAMPYLGRDAARRELLRATTDDTPPSPKEALKLLHGVSGRAVRDRRALAALGAVAKDPGMSNVQVARRAGIKDQGQTSRLLSRLARLGLIKNRLNGEGLPLASNAWELTHSGETLLASLTEGNESQTSSAAARSDAVSRAPAGEASER